MIYLFTNLDFGRNLLDALAQVNKASRLDAVVVLSGKRGWPPGRLSRLRARVAWALRRRRLAREVSSQYGLPVVFCDDVNSRRFLRQIGSDDDGFIAGYNQIFKGVSIGRFRTLVNCHPSLLPFYRGPTPSHWCLYFGETATGYTFHHVVERIDAGEIIWQESVEIERGDSASSLNERISRRAAQAFRRYLASLRGASAFERSTLDAARIYRHHAGYLSFPGRS